MGAAAKAVEPSPEMLRCNNEPFMLFVQHSVVGLVATAFNGKLPAPTAIYWDSCRPSWAASEVCVGR